jgi:hypothetical protein
VCQHREAAALNQMPLTAGVRNAVEQFISAVLENGSESEELLSHFFLSVSRRLDELPDDPTTSNQKLRFAAYLLAIFLRNLYRGSAPEFYWRPGNLRQSAFRLAEKLGVHILPLHFYSPVPAVDQFDEGLWSRASELPGIDMRESQQLELLATLAQQFREEFGRFPERAAPNAPAYTYYTANGAFGGIDAAFLYSLIRHCKPRRIYEVGSGFSTFLAAEAVLKNHNDDPAYQCELVAIEPYPSPALQRGFPGLSRLIPSRIQQLPPQEFAKLCENDILFIDSSHVLKLGSDVQYEFLEILPRLNHGVLVHIHDIFLPFEYPREWAREMNRYWTEQYLLQAFLIHNSAFEVLLAAAYLNARHPDALAASFPSLPSSRGFGSFWIRKLSQVQLSSEVSVKFPASGASAAVSTRTR